MSERAPLSRTMRLCWWLVTPGTAYLAYTLLPIAFSISSGKATGIGFSFEGALERIAFGWLLASFVAAHLWLTRALWVASRHRGLASMDLARTAVLGLLLLACYAPAIVLALD